MLFTLTLTLSSSTRKANHVNNDVFFAPDTASFPFVASALDDNVIGDFAPPFCQINGQIHVKKIGVWLRAFSQDEAATLYNDGVNEYRQIHFPVDPNDRRYAMAGGLVSFAALGLVVWAGYRKYGKTRRSDSLLVATGGSLELRGASQQMMHAEEGAEMGHANYVAMQDA